MADEDKQVKKEEANTEKENESKPEPEDTAKEVIEEEKASEEAVEEAANAKKEEKQLETKEDPKPSSQDQVKGKEVKVSGKLAGIIKDIESISVIELADLVKALEEKFGVTAAAPVTMAAAASTDGGDEGPSEEQSSFNVVITDAGSNKISVIKAVREIVPTLGLKEAKDLVDAAPKAVLEGAGKDASKEAKEKLEAAGAKVELQ